MSWQVEARKHLDSWHVWVAQDWEKLGIKIPCAYCVLLWERRRMPLTYCESGQSFIPPLPPRGNGLHLSSFSVLMSFRTSHMLRQLQKELSNHYFSGYGQNLLVLESPYETILTICRAAGLFKDGGFFICDS